MSGFYKINTEQGGLFHAPNFVYNADFGKLTKDDKDKELADHVDGWKWFETEAEAHTYFNVSLFPEQIAILQAKLALKAVDMLNYISFTDQSVKDKWEKADIKVATPELIAVGDKLGLTEDQKNIIFESEVIK